MAKHSGISENIQGFLERPPSSSLLTASCSNKSFFPRKNMGKNQQLEKEYFVGSKELNYLYKENSRLREENRNLRREIILMKGESYINKTFDALKVEQVDTLRDTIKRESGELKQSRNKIEVLTNQCRLYENIMENMESKVQKLTKQNKELEKLLIKQKSSSLENSVKKTLCTQEETPAEIKARLNGIMDLYIQLESQMNQSEVEWAVWKANWSNEKKYYFNRISHLECLLGIKGDKENSDKDKPIGKSKDFLKKSR